MECADADKYDRIYCNALTVINKIVFTSPEAMVEFSGEKNITSALVKTFANIYSFERSILLRAMRCHYRQNSALPIFVNGAFIFVNGAFRFCKWCLSFCKWCLSFL